MLRRLNIRTKLTVLLVVVGLVPALAMTAMIASERSDIEQLARTRVQNAAIAAMDVIDRNLFERYGDVQAFALNGYAHDPANWRKPGADNPLVAAMNGYMANYGLYRLTLLVDTKGQVLAVNSQDATGKPLDTAALYGHSLAGAPWLAKALGGEFLKGANGLTGSVVLPPTRDERVGALYGDDGFTVVFAAPVKNARNETIGVWANFADFGLVDQIVEQFYRDIASRGMQSAEITVLDQTGTILVDFDPEKLADKKVKRDHAVIGKLNLAKAGVAAAVAAVGGETGSIDARHARKGVVQAAGYAHGAGAYGYPGLGWSTLVRVPVEEAYATVYSIQRSILIALACFIAVSISVGLWIGTTASRPLIRMTAAMGRLANRDWTTEIPALGRRDEIGQMAGAVQVFKDAGMENDKLQAAAEVARQKHEQQETEKHRLAEETARETERKLKELEERMLRTAEEQKQAEERHRQENARQRGAEMNQLADAFEATVKGVVETVSASAAEMHSSAASMSATAEETSRKASVVASASEEASTNVQTVASATEELSASIQEITRQVAESARIAGVAVDEAKSTGQAMDGLAQAATKIGDVVKLITDIASQTNLLALNATIEAARAGEAGKGFAVVASEVKTLANQTAKATDEIARQIQAIQGATEGAVQAIQSIGKTIEQVNAVASTIAAAVEEQGAATKEISRNVQQAAAGTQQVSRNIGSVNEAAGEVGSAATQMSAGSSELARQAETLSTEVDRFIRKVRAA